MENNHISRTATITLNATPDKILPLFTAYGETLWIKGWNPEYVYPADGAAEIHSVWKTQHDGEPDTIWLTICYDLEALKAVYVNTMPGRQVTRIDIQCAAVEEGKTTAQVTYTITALGEKGFAYIKQLTQEHYDLWMQNSWEMDINYYLHHGEAAPH